MKLFGRKRNAVKKWHERALMIDPRKTKLTFLSGSEAKHIPPWVYKKYGLPETTQE